MSPPQRINLRDRLQRLERRWIERALEKTEGNHTHAARYLGLQRTCLVMKIKKLRYQTDFKW